MSFPELSHSNPSNDASTKHSHNLITSVRQGGILAGLVLLVGVFSFSAPGFMSEANIINVLLASSVTAILAMGQTYVILTAGIDLSVGSMLALTGILGALMLNAHVPIILAIILTLIAGALAGVINGVVVTLLNVTPFIVTLGTMSVFTGLALIVSGGQTIYNLPSGFVNLLSSNLTVVPVPVIIMVLVAGILAFVQKNTLLGEWAMAIGGNEEAARTAGISVISYKIAVYSIAGLLAAVAALITTARLAAADPNAGSDLLLTSIAASVMGGASLMGGEGSIIGAVLGAILISTLQAGLTMLNVQAFYQDVAIGVVIVLAVAMDQLGRRAQR